MKKKIQSLTSTLKVLIAAACLAGGGVYANPNCTAEQGQQLIEDGQYMPAIQVFTCLVNAQPTGVEGYRGRIEALVLLRRYSDAVRDYARVTAQVMPTNPNASASILAGYQARLAASPTSVTALTGASFAYWWFFQYNHAIQTLTQLEAVQPDSAFGNLFFGSSRLLSGASRNKGVEDLERAILLDPANPHVRFIVADAYTYGALPDATRAFAEANTALFGGLNTPRIHAILAACHSAFGNVQTAAVETKIHFDQVTQQLLSTAALNSGSSQSLALVPGRTFEIPILVTAAGQIVSIDTSSKDFWDTILVLLAPDGTPLIASDDTFKYFARLQQWPAPAAGTYRLLVTSFESVNTGTMLVTRQ